MKNDATSSGSPGADLKRIRNEILMVLKMLYPAALQAGQLLRSLLTLFPTLEWDALRRDLAYLTEKGYVQRIVSDTENDEKLTPWRRRWFRVTPRGLEIAERLMGDPALEE